MKIKVMNLFTFCIVLKNHKAHFILHQNKSQCKT